MSLNMTQPRPLEHPVRLSFVTSAKRKARSPSPTPPTSPDRRLRSTRSDPTRLPKRISTGIQASDAAILVHLPSPPPAASDIPPPSHFELVEGARERFPRHTSGPPSSASTVSDEEGDGDDDGSRDEDLSDDDDAETSDEEEEDESAGSPLPPGDDEDDSGDESDSSINSDFLDTDIHEGDDAVTMKEKLMLRDTRDELQVIKKAIEEAHKSVLIDSNSSSLVHPVSILFSPFVPQDTHPEFVSGLQSIEDAKDESIVIAYNRHKNQESNIHASYEAEKQMYQHSFLSERHAVRRAHLDELGRRKQQIAREKRKWDNEQAAPFGTRSHPSLPCSFFSPKDSALFAPETLHKKRRQELQDATVSSRGLPPNRDTIPGWAKDMARALQKSGKPPGAPGFTHQTIRFPPTLRLPPSPSRWPIPAPTPPRRTDTDTSLALTESTTSSSPSRLRVDSGSWPYASLAPPGLQDVAHGGDGNPSHPSDPPAPSLAKEVQAHRKSDCCTTYTLLAAMQVRQRAKHRARDASVQTASATRINSPSCTRHDGNEEG
ncbi:hypothetical protein BDK51DRAFT_46725 [Blyttiomyces helicus]|uniref:Uncharacterized protein n=1 Tax=Blyttiomyces helicus TaxID=388810 RepID=A0A4P9WGR1_9FUNG|nr:hypothetical protein BDK51DRAFT_46725 [Blyttiomyces helicus]|eukprot:RKO90230.1 hypothetical protein BDK51DRAFT_46725 [Blyttiomyces helicus]